MRPLVIALVVVVAGGIWWLLGTRGNGPSDRLVLYGNVDIREADLAFANSEHVEQLLVREGDRVHKGQLLATLHTERMAAEVAIAAARVAAQRAIVARLEAGSRPEEIRRGRDEVAAAEARLDDAQRIHRRTAQLYQRNAVSKQVLDSARTALDVAQAELRASQETLALLEAGPRQEDIDEARAMLAANEAQLALAREVLEDASLYAPFDGIIRDRIVEPGEMVSPQTPIFTLALTDPLWVRAYAPESSLGRLRPGMAASVSTDSYPDTSYRGWVGYVSPTAEFTPKSVETPELRTRLVYQVRVHVCNPNDELRLGMPATVTIPFDGSRSEGDRRIPTCTSQGGD
ncbi:HlyD family efflux transporter periplasmic adaptor subunit [Halomonas nitroreducens]|uniref:HlyD family efflux transporter periplasmic adaptor subunit n=1 Tax=Halomonas nitroreducens TaxID=447425 RepID=A0A3S0HVA1_9GAMM|nr:HlyD family efflux transporter periplasmic adaptor subunit [Halomonas nitroreducens]